MVVVENQNDSYLEWSVIFVLKTVIFDRKYQSFWALIGHFDNELIAVLVILRQSLASDGKSTLFLNFRYIITVILWHLWRLFQEKVVKNVTSALNA